MTAKQKTVTGLVILVLVFLLGFVPQYLEKRQNPERTRNLQ
jgi:hypothetical protein